MDLHIPPVAGLIFAAALIIVALGPIFGAERAPDAWIGAWVVVWSLTAVYLLFAL